MGRIKANISPLAISKLKKPGMNFVGYVSGLALYISHSGARSWILRAMVAGKRCDIGLGSFPEVSLARARESAISKRQQIRDGINPIEARKQAIAALKAEQVAAVDFETAARQYISVQQSGWKNAKHATQWTGTLTAYAYPAIGKLLVKNIGLNDVLRVLEPIWTVIPETASRLRGRIEVILDWAKVRGYRTGDNPAQWRGNLAAVLPARGKIAQVQHFKALDWQQCPKFVADLKLREGSAIDALLFLLMTACRSGEVRGAVWSEIDFNRQVWTIPASRMKAKKEHRIPLPTSAIELLTSLHPQTGPQLIFPSTNGKMLSDMALTAVLKRMKVAVTVHGFRSTFRDWAGETTAFPREVIEHALAHQLRDKAEAAYARGDLFDKRKKLMAAWSNFLFGQKQSPAN
jgi:integrase